ncbi:MAG: transglutaminase-like putative cysteine protease, partial [Kiritimatiellia bacterium]
MTIRVALHHKTKYIFDRRVNLAPHVIRLRPAAHARTPIHAYSLNILPKEHFINWMQDPFGNYQARIVFPDKTDYLSIEVEVIADMTVINPFDFFVEEYAEFFPFAYDQSLESELLPYLEIKEQGEQLVQWVADFKNSVKNEKEYKINTFLVNVNQRLEQDIDYTIRMEVGVQDCEDTLSKALGSCRDSAWLMVQVFRHLGLAARFVSGYLVQLTADVKSLDGPSGTEEDFTDLHAWCEVFIPGAGWIGLDPTSGLFAGEGHIPLACTPNPGSAAPISGASDKCEVEFEFSNEVMRILEDPRVTKPYDDEQWHSINALGEAVDLDLEKGDVRLTMGGEPTFVSVDDMESEQWNTAALGDDKLALSKSLLLRMRDNFAKGGLLHYGQGKWYPGEEVPRWALGCFWRTDGVPLWKNDDLLARVDKDYGVDRKQARRFLQSLCQSLRVPMNYIISAFEDAGHYLVQEQELPDNIDLYEEDLSSDLERQRLAKVLKQGLNTACGFVLPLEWRTAGNHWASTKWPLRRSRLIAVPGDSPLGLRLPLHALPHSSEQAIYRPEEDPFAPKTNAAKEVNAAPKIMTELMRTALIVEPRDGRLFIFLPPLQSFQDYVNLINAIEATAEKLSIPVILEGYEPPKDPRLKVFKVTPDPGVIEVNIHPSKTWGELVEKTTVLYEQARLCRLGTEKFMLDGRHTGTGGGNHVTIGAAAVADSPILRRPDVLQSLITYWQHHPSLSYLFSGMFIGPTSQAPRVDEGRDEILYELEVAFKQVPAGVVDQPWLVDRIFRNLLIDITGNTHRAEFC